MAADSFDFELNRLLKFDPTDLAANQQGRLTTGQRVRLLRDADSIFPLILLGSPLVVIAWVINQQPFVQILGFVVLIAVIAIFNRKSVNLLLDVLVGRVASTAGIIAILVYSTGERTFAGTLVRSFATGRIGDLNFQVPVEMAAHFNGAALRVYYLPRARKAVSAEQVSL
ncbi:MAG: hypothetical protein GC204_10670 [Chloroflexi bacterium]|nr:hypothetical protein [Chloroflexota bacterium]